MSKLHIEPPAGMPHLISSAEKKSTGFFLEPVYYYVLGGTYLCALLTIILAFTA